MTAQIQAFFDPKTSTVSYVVADLATARAAVIDPVLDFDFKSGRTTTVAADRILDFIRQRGLQLDWILETHAHADHISGARHIQQHAHGRIAIGAHIRDVQAVFKKLFIIARSTIKTTWIHPVNFKDLIRNTAQKSSIMGGNQIPKG